MGNTAKLMLVGILVLVIVIAIIWDKQSEELQESTSIEGDGISRGITLDGSSLVEQMQGHSSDRTVVRGELSSGLVGTEEATDVTVDTATPSSEPGRQNTPEQRTYTVKKNESYWKIAKKVYKDGTKWELIFDANKDKFPRQDSIREGSVIVIPPLPKKPKVQKPAEIVKDGVCEIGRDGNRYYTVKKGDVLSKISQKSYGTSKRWREILEANSDILPDEHSVVPGMRLIIP